MFDKNKYEYSGVVEIAFCSKNCIKSFHANLNDYNFKKKFLMIKNGNIFFKIYFRKNYDL
jgi:hypothetical protein